MLMLPIWAAVAFVQPTPPPIISLHGDPAPSSVLVLRAGEARCDGEVERPHLTEPPLPVELGFIPPAWRAEPPQVRLTFRIDADGRPLSISEGGPFLPLQAQLRDLVPAFSLWRFAPGRQKRDCEIIFTGTVYSVAATPLTDLHRLVILGQPSSGFRSTLRDRLTPPGSTCFNPGPAVRQRNYPAFEQIPQVPGTASYALVGFDIDARGRPTNLRLADSGGNAALARQSLDAVRRSRFAPGARRGCTYPYWRRSQEVIAAPPVPESAAYRTADSTCPETGSAWAQLPRLVFPAGFEGRRIEGWAVLRYDVAPWGETANVVVVAAEPSARFGSQAADIVRTARATPSSTGATGCIDRVVFRLPATGEEPRETGAD